MGMQAAEQKTFYIAGPMSGIPGFNIPAFDAAAARLRDMGFDIISPSELDHPAERDKALASKTGDPAELTNSWGDCLSRDVKIVADVATDIIFLDGWAGSRGARLEAFVGVLLGKEFWAYKPYTYPMYLHKWTVAKLLIGGLLNAAD